MKKNTIIKLILLVLFLAFVIYVARSEDVSMYLTKEGIRDLVKSAGVWGPTIFILIYIIGICLLFPGTIITAAGAVAFGTMYGFIYSMIGASLAAGASFYVARYLGRDFVDKFLKGGGKRFEKYNEKLEENGFATIFYLRMIFMPYTPINFIAGLTKIKFSDYFWGTFWGILPGTFIFTFFFDSITNVTTWSDLLHWKIILSVVLFVVSFFIPVFVKKMKNKLKKSSLQQNH